MGSALKILNELRDGDAVEFTFVTNQSDGIATFAYGHLKFRRADVATGEPARLKLVDKGALAPGLVFSDRMRPGGGQYPISQRFASERSEPLDVTMRPTGDSPVMHITLWNNTSPVTLAPMGDLLVGQGPSLGNSGPAVFVVAFISVGRDAGPPK